MRRIVLAGGGSAGHVEPALAVADAIGSIDMSASCEFLGTASGLENKLVPERGYQLRLIPKATFPRRIGLPALTFPARLALAFITARQIIKGASVVIGFGGYVSAAAYLAAWSLRVPIVIHEANAKPGWANRLGRRFAKATAVNFRALSLRWPGAKLIGMPIRSSISEIARIEERDREVRRAATAVGWGFDPKLPIIAIFGGSLGAIQINQAVSGFLRTQPKDIQIIHAVGTNNAIPERSANYLPMAYFDNIADIYLAADLLITRSGAVTCSEIATVGVFAILVPLPHGNGEQAENAVELVEKGRALRVANSEFTAEWLTANLRMILSRARTSSRTPDIRNETAARQIAELALAQAL